MKEYNGIFRYLGTTEPHILFPQPLYSITLTDNKTNENIKIEIKVIQDKNSQQVVEIKFLRNKKVVQKAIPCIDKETNKQGFYMTKENKFYKEVFYNGYQCYVNREQGFCLVAKKNGKIGFYPLSKRDVEEINKLFVM